MMFRNFVAARQVLKAARLIYYLYNMNSVHSCFEGQYFMTYVVFSESYF